MISKKIFYNAKNLKKNQIVLDIETTGLSPIYDKLVLLGFVSYIDNKSYILQYFAENDMEEKRLLEIFLEHAKNKEIINYNGEVFDLPFLNSRLKHHGLKSNNIYDSFDIYKLIRSKRFYIDFESMKLMDIEKILDINRNDPSRYKVFSKLNETQTKRDNPYPILVHNQNDLISTEKLIIVEDLIKNKLSIKNKKDKLTLLDIYINNDIAMVDLQYSKNLHEAHFYNNNYQLKIEKNKIIVYFSVIYGKISPNMGGYVTKNIFNLENQSKFIINKSMLIVREGRLYNYKNILNHCLAIIKENLNL